MSYIKFQTNNIIYSFIVGAYFIIVEMTIAKLDQLAILTAITNTLALKTDFWNEPVARDKDTEIYMAMRFSLEKGLGLLVLLTGIAMLNERSILYKSTTLDASDGVVSIYGDNQAGGNSQAEIVDPKAMTWVCELREGSEYTYCGFELIFSPFDRTLGLDLRDYDTLRFWLDYEGPTSSVRLYLRNYDPAYSSPDKFDSTKYNQVEFDSNLLEPGEPITFSIDDFFVANWWLYSSGIAPELSHPQFDNVVIVEVQTGSNPQLGRHEFTLSKIELEGQWLSSKSWYQGILGVWLLAALSFLAARSLSLSRELKRKSERERELVEINRLLDNRGQELEERAKTDPLTGAFNREGLGDAMRLGLAEWRREAKPMSIVMLDLDHFKKINDTYGHAVGDRILAGVSALVKQSVRTSDIFARWGGEEFLLLCRNTSLVDAHGVAQKLCRLISENDFGEAMAQKVSASFGVAQLRSGESLDQIFERVDKALYEAKQQGRNRVEISP